MDIFGVNPDDDKSGGTIFPEKDKDKDKKSGDIGRLIEKLESMESSLLSIQEGISGPLGDNSLRPKKEANIEDLLGGKPLKLIIPSGFILLHRDLQDIVKSLKGGSGGSSSGTSWEDVTNQGIKSATTLGIAGIGAGLLSRWTEGMTLPDIFKSVTDFASNAIDLVPKAGQAIGDAVENVGNSLALLFVDIENLATDEDIKRIHKAAQSNYLAAYYSRMIEETGYKLDLGFDANGIPMIKGLSEDDGTFTDREIADYALDKGKNVLASALMGFKNYKFEAIADSVTNALTKNLPALMSSYNMLFDEETKSVVAQMSGLVAQANLANIIKGFGYSVDFTNPSNPKLKEREKGTQDVQDWIDYGWDKAKEALGTILTGGVGLGIEAISGSVSKSMANIGTALSVVSNMDNNPYIEEYTGPLMAKYAALMIKELMNESGYDVDINDPTSPVVRYSSGDNFVEAIDSANTIFGKITVGVSKGFDLISSAATDVISGLSDLITAPFASLIRGIGNAIGDVKMNNNINDLLVSKIEDDLIGNLPIFSDENKKKINDKAQGIVNTLYNDIGKIQNVFISSDEELDVLKRNYSSAVAGFANRVSNTLSSVDIKDDKVAGAFYESIRGSAIKLDFSTSFSTLESTVSRESSIIISKLDAMALQLTYINNHTSTMDSNMSGIYTDTQTISQSLPISVQAPQGAPTIAENDMVSTGS